MTGRSRRRFAALLGSALTLTSLVGVPVAASAQTTTEWWYEFYGVEAAHAAGTTGDGVKIAVFDDQINPDLPIFDGARLTVDDTNFCRDREPAIATTEPTAAAVHGSTMTAILVGNGSAGPRGIAPGADVTFYGYGTTENQSGCAPASDGDISTLGLMIKKAVDDGADIITTSVGATPVGEDFDALAYAYAKGVVIVAATQNPNEFATAGTSISAANGVVAASAVDRTGALQRDDLTNEYLALDETTVVAAGIDVATAGVSGDWSTAGRARGSSFSAPVVTGMLALAAQRYPDATANQLLQSLIATTNGSLHAPERVEAGYGYGAAALTTLLQTDPGQFPDDNPLMAQPLSEPTAETVARVAAEGWELPGPRGDSFDQYGEPTSTPEADAPASDASANPLVPMVIGVVAVVVLAAIVTLILVLIRKRRPRKESA